MSHKVSYFVDEYTERNLDKLEKPNDDLPIHLYMSPDEPSSSSNSSNTSLSSISLFLSTHVVNPTNQSTQTAKKLKDNTKEYFNASRLAFVSQQKHKLQRILLGEAPNSECIA